MAAGEGPPGRIRLVVLFGGVSAEHDVSCMTAAHVLGAADRSRYDLHPVGITLDGEWVHAEAASEALAGGPAALPESLDPSGPVLQPAAALSPSDDREKVVVLPLMHGPFGEDGTVQGLLELADVAYVGAGVLSSALCMDKAMAKVVTGAAGLPQGRYLAVRDIAADGDFLQRVVDELGLPVFVKPANLGSSVGVSKAATADELKAAVSMASSYDEWVLVEEALDAREIEVGVLGNAEPRASVPGEIVPTHDFYDYADKYLDGAAQMVIPADLTPDVAAEARELAVRAYRVLRCEGMARVDFFYEQDRRGLLLNEVNTIPGFTPWSMYPSLWAASGVGYGELIDELVTLAVARHAHRRGLGRPQA